MAKTFRAGARECFVARPGHAIVSVDMDAFEMRTWAQICVWLFGMQAVALAHILNDPKRCPHVEMGQRIWTESQIRPITLEEAYLLKGKDRGDLRGVAKGPNFGLPGGMQAERLMAYCWTNYRVPMSIEVAQIARQVWTEVYPEALPYLDWVKDQVGRKYGSRAQIQQFYSKRLRGDVGYTDAANGYFQGLAADIAKVAGSRLTRAAYVERGSPLYGCRPLAFVHDEWLYEIPVDRIHEAGHYIAKVMTETAMEICPDLLFTASPAAMYAWSKAAGDPVYAVDGKVCKGSAPGARLVVYEDSLQMEKAA